MFDGKAGKWEGGHAGRAAVQEALAALAPTKGYPSADRSRVLVPPNPRAPGAASQHQPACGIRAGRARDYEPIERAEGSGEDGPGARREESWAGGRGGKAEAVWSFERPQRAEGF